MTSYSMSMSNWNLLFADCEDDCEDKNGSAIQTADIAGDEGMESKRQNKTAIMKTRRLIKRQS